MVEENKIPEETGAANLSEFNEWARSFAARAKSGGASNFAIADGLNFMFNMFKQEQANKISEQQNALAREKWDYAKAKAEEETDKGELREVTDAVGNKKLIRIKEDGSIEEVYDPMDEIRELPGTDSFDAEAGSATGLDTTQVPLTPDSDIFQASQDTAALDEPKDGFQLATERISQIDASRNPSEYGQNIDLSGIGQPLSSDSLQLSGSQLRTQKPTLNLGNLNNTDWKNL